APAQPDPLGPGRLTTGLPLVLPGNLHPGQVLQLVPGPGAEQALHPQDGRTPGASGLHRPLASAPLPAAARPGRSIDRHHLRLAGNPAGPARPTRTRQAAPLFPYAGGSCLTRTRAKSAPVN